MISIRQLERYLAKAILRLSQLSLIGFVLASMAYYSFRGLSLLNIQSIPHKSELSLSVPKKVQVYDFSSVAYSFGDLHLDRTVEISRTKFRELIVQSTPYPQQRRLFRHLNSILEVSLKYQIDPFWLIAVIGTESSFRHWARSYVQAYGLMQIMPDTGIFLSRLIRRQEGIDLVDMWLKDPIVNVEMGAFYLKRLLGKFGGNYRYATAAYNLGPARVRSRLRANRAVGVKNRYLDRVIANYNSFSREYREQVMGQPRPYETTLVVREFIPTIDLRAEVIYFLYPIEFLYSLSTTEIPADFHNQNMVTI